MRAFHSTLLKWIVGSYCAMISLIACTAEPDLEIELNGKVIADNCKANSVELDLGKHFVSVINGEDKTPPVNFDINISACPLGKRSIKIRFDGTADQGDPSTFFNEGGAKNVSIVLFDPKSRKNLEPGSILPIPLREEPGSGTLSGKKPLQAWMKGARFKEVTVGTVKATISMVLIYQ